ncbi:hypothetical protein [Geobacter sp. DSM 9736]|uniref:hypothetical protein n=1 Tax=Geobacter sp. DSM 9736 TaxID=1277350 RepID=UPI000B4FDD89|nr:hypothetical protein [Geobacter sp. DSM 9736]SNB47869.1 hypothetical protein SAMN06269301_3363 [Geobacter sp. DSM 9736]
MNSPARGALIGCFLLLAGCATTDRRVNILYEPSVGAKGGTGDLYLVGDREAQGKKVQWVIGEVINNRKEQVGNIVTDLAPAELVLDAFAAELRSAGYRVVMSRSIPADVDKGLVLGDVSITLREVDGLFQSEARNKMKVAIEVWRKGVKLTKLDYETEYVDSTVRDRRRLAEETLRTSLRNFLRQAVPEIIRKLEQ